MMPLIAIMASILMWPTAVLGEDPLMACYNSKERKLPRAASFESFLQEKPPRHVIYSLPTPFCQPESSTFSHVPMWSLHHQCGHFVAMMPLMHPHTILHTLLMYTVSFSDHLMLLCIISVHFEIIQSPDPFIFIRVPHSHPVLLPAVGSACTRCGAQPMLLRLPTHSR